jgi:hypothetical protein
MPEINEYMGRDGFIWFIGVVEDRNDPLELGRVRVRCLGYHSENLSEIPTSSLPWAHVMHPTTDPAMHGMGKTPSFLVEGGWVCGFFRDSGENQQPVVIGTLPGIPETPGGIEQTYTKGFNDPRHKNSIQTNLLTDGKDYSMPYGDKTFNPIDRYTDIGGEIEGDLAENVRPDYGKESYGPYPLGGFVNGKDDKDGVFGRASGHTYGESDTNRLARGGDHGVLTAKDNSTTQDIRLANSADSWKEPLTTDTNKNSRPRYGSKYPYNHVFESESGHIKEYDDTPGSERIHEYHTVGTFYEIDADGNKQTRVVGDNYEVVAGSNYVNIKGTANLTIDSNCNTYIKGDWNIQVDGNVREVIGGTLTQSVAGAVTESYSSSLNTTIVGTTGILHQDVATYHYVDDFQEKIDKDHYVDKEGGKVDHTHPVSPARTTGEEEVEGLLEIDDVL